MNHIQVKGLDCCNDIWKNNAIYLPKASISKNKSPLTSIEKKAADDRELLLRFLEALLGCNP